jgi:hypothetical protein
MISVFVKGLLPDFFAIANTSKYQKLCAVVPHRVPEPGTGCRKRRRLETLGLKMQPKNMVSGLKNQCSARYPVKKGLFFQSLCLKQSFSQPNS